MELDDRETATVLAALRCFQVFGHDGDGNIAADLQDHFAEHKPLSDVEIDSLCERINLGK